MSTGVVVDPVKGTRFTKRQLVRSETASQAYSNQTQLTDNDKTLHITSNGSDIFLHVTQQNVIVNNLVAASLYLPSVAEARNLSYKITITGSEDITLFDRYADSADWCIHCYCLGTAGDNITLSSDGQKWSVVENNIA